MSASPPPLLVMIHHNRWDLTRLAVSSLKAHTCHPYRLLLIDNASGDDLASLTPDELITNEHPRSFAANCNLGLRASSGAAVALLNNDLYFPPGWLEGLLRALQLGFGIAGALTNTDVPLDKFLGHGLASLGPRFEPEDLADKWPVLSRVLGVFNTQGRQRPPTKQPWVAFFAVALSAGVVQEVGLLDEGFIQGYEDLDYCLRAWEKGYSVVKAMDAYVVHFGGKAMVPADAAEMAARDAHNVPLFLQHWPPDRREALLHLWSPHGLEAKGRQIWAGIEHRRDFLTRIGQTMVNG